MADSPTIDGPHSGGTHGWPFAATVTDLAGRAYEELEYVMAGDAVRYRLARAGAYGADGRWAAEPDGTIPYRTRILVRRPVDPAARAATVLLSWNNVSAGYENVTELTDAVADLGIVQVCVTAQRVGVHGFPFPDPKGLRSWDPERYGDLDVPDDDASYGIFTHAAVAARSLAGVEEARLVAIGASQSAQRLATYHNAVQPLTSAFDAFVLDVWRGSGSLLDARDEDAERVDYGPMTSLINLLTDHHRLRADLGVPVLVVNSETEAAEFAPARQDDTDTYRLWDVAGAAHASSDRWELAEARTARDFGSSPSPFVPPDDKNTISLDPVREAVVGHVHRWVHGGAPPPAQPRLVLAGDPLRLVRDELGNTVGGIRLPDMAVPVATHVGERTGPADMFGRSTPLPVEVLRARYRDAAGYLRRVDAAVEQALAAEVLLPADAERLRRAARDRASALFA